MVTTLRPAVQPPHRAGPLQGNPSRAGGAAWSAGPNPRPARPPQTNSPLNQFRHTRQRLDAVAYVEAGGVDGLAIRGGAAAAPAPSRARALLERQGDARLHISGDGECFDGKRRSQEPL